MGAHTNPYTPMSRFSAKTADFRPIPLDTRNMNAVVCKANVLLNAKGRPRRGEVCAEVFNEQIAIVSGVAGVP